MSLFHGLASAGCASVNLPAPICPTGLYTLSPRMEYTLTSCSFVAFPSPSDPQTSKSSRRCEAWSDVSSSSYTRVP